MCGRRFFVFFKESKEFTKFENRGINGTKGRVNSMVRGLKITKILSRETKKFNQKMKNDRKK